MYEFSVGDIVNVNGESCVTGTIKDCKVIEGDIMYLVDWGADTSWHKENDLKPYVPDEYDDGMSDVEADADVFRSVGWGTDEDYGMF